MCLFFIPRFPFEIKSRLGGKIIIKKRVGIHFQLVFHTIFFSLGLFFFKEKPSLLVGGEGLEPSRYYYHKILSLARLPVPPAALILITHNYNFNTFYQIML